MSASSAQSVQLPPRYGRRLLRALPAGLLNLLLTLGGLLLLTFTLASLSPIDPALQLVGDHASASSYAQARHQLGLDQPWPQQLADYVARLAHGDLGVSRSTGQAVGADLSRVFPATLELATLAWLCAAGTGLALGIVSARRPGGIADGASRVFSLLGNSIPVYWIGLMALLLFYADLHWASGPGRLDDAYEYTIDMKTNLVLLDSWRSGEPGAFASALRHLLLPVLLLAGYALGGVARLSRAALLEELGKDYVTLARAKGAGEWRVLLRHVVPNVAGPLLTVASLAYTNLLQGAVLTETVFAWPGLGRYLTTAVFAADAPAILGGTLLLGLCFIAINSATDVLVRLLNPRLR